MINEKFDSNFNMFVDGLNNLRSVCRKNNKPLPDPLKRISDTIKFILQKIDVDGFDLSHLKDELSQMTKDARRLKELFIGNPNSLLLEGYIDWMIIDLDVEIESREVMARNLSSNPLKETQSFQAEKVKVFKSSSAIELEKQINAFLAEAEYEIIRTTQTVDHHSSICIVIFYKKI